MLFWGFLFYVLYCCSIGMNLFCLVGFGAFMFCVACGVFISGAIYISPMFCGSPNEKKLISKPQEVDAGNFFLAHPRNAICNETVLC